MKKMCTLMLALLLVFTCSACSNKKATAKKENKTQTDLKEANSKSLVVYFSWSGNTQNIAREIQKQTNSDIFEIIPEVAYSDDYDTVVDDAKKEQFFLPTRLFLSNMPKSTLRDDKNIIFFNT